MTLLILLQAVAALVVLNVIVGRFAKRRSDGHRRDLFSDEVKLRETDIKIIEAQRREHLGQQRIVVLNDALAGAEEQLAAAEKELDAARKAPPDLYFVFDRLEPKPGIIWEVEVGRQSDVPVSARLEAVWKDPRRYLIAAKTPREARDRASQRFFEKAGLTVVHVSPCALFLPKRADGRPLDGMMGDDGGEGEGRKGNRSTAMERTRG